MITNEKMFIRNGEIIDFECDIDNLHLYILVEKDKFLPYVHSKGKGFERVKQLSAESKTKIQDFIEQRRKVTQLQQIFEVCDCGTKGISSYLKSIITRDKFDYIRYITERDLKNKRMKLFNLQDFFNEFHDIEHNLTITRIYDEEKIKLKFYTVKQGINSPSFSYLFGRRGDLVGELILHIELIGMYHDKKEDTFIIRSIEEVRC